MYVNTLITLQENFSTYGLDGNKVTGHVTLNSPGLIKCYVQNLKQSISGQTYALYAFSKAKDKGVRIGALSSNKETKWMVEAKNIGGSGITLEEVDGVAIVSEDNQRGADTILMGFKNNRYMIIPLIDQITRKRLSPKPQTSGSTGNSENHTKKSMKPENPPPEPQKPVEVESPVPKPLVMGCLGSPMPKLPQQPVPGCLGSLPPMPPVPESLAKPTPSVPTLEEVNKPTPSVPTLESPNNSSPSVSVQESSDDLTQSSPPNPSTEEVSEHMVEADEIPSDLGPSVLQQKDSTQEPGPVIPNSSMPEYQEETGGADTVNISVLKIAEMLKEIEMKAKVEPIAKANQEKEEREDAESLNQDIKQNLEDKTRIHKKVTQELRRIINILRENKENREEDRGVKEQIEKMRELPQSHKLTEKPTIEKTLESRYMEQKIEECLGEEHFERIISNDTTPKKALNFILKQQDEVEFVANKTPEGTESREEAYKEKVEQPPIDYLSEIDKKIKEIEAKRKQEKY